MGIVHTKWSARATLIAALTMFGSIATARSNQCNLDVGGGTFNLDPYTAVATAGLDANAGGVPAGTYSCSVNVVAQQGQQYLWLRYQEVWFDTEGSTALVCGGGSGQLSCADTVTITITGPNLSDITTLSGAGTTIPLTDNGPAWEVLNSDPSFGQIWGRTWTRTIPVSGSTQFQNALYQVSITQVFPQNADDTAVYGTFTVGRAVALVDPVSSLVSTNYTQLVSDPESLASRGIVISGVSADSAAQVVIRIQAQNSGQAVNLTLFNDQGGAPTPAQDGSLSTVNGPSGAGTLNLTAVNTNEGPMAFAVYHPPPSFARVGNTNDGSASNRKVTIQWKLGSPAGSSSPSVTESAMITLWRPPVYLVHGQWGSYLDWNAFTGELTDAYANLGLFITAANYNRYVSGSVSQSIPSYPPLNLLAATNSSLGFKANAPVVLNGIRELLVDFRNILGVAAAQVDVVAHSMGGDVTRYAIATLADYTGPESFGVGNIHELITIGTPHLGSALAADLIGLGNGCSASFLASKGKFAISTATVGGVPNVAGSAADLSPGSDNLNALNSGGPQVPAALIAGAMAQTNLNNLDPSNCNLSQPSLNVGPCVAVALRNVCPNDQLAQDLTPTGWPNVFAPPTAANNSDAAVSTLSQCNSSSGSLPASCSIIPGGVVHSSGMEVLGFGGPAELDALSGAVSLVIKALNDIITDTSLFIPLH